MVRGQAAGAAGSGRKPPPRRRRGVMSAPSADAGAGAAACSRLTFFPTGGALAGVKLGPPKAHTRSPATSRASLSSTMVLGWAAMASASSRRAGASWVSMRMVPKGESRTIVAPSVDERTRSVAVEGADGHLNTPPPRSPENDPRNSEQRARNLRRGRMRRCSAFRVCDLTQRFGRRARPKRPDS